MKSFTSTRGKKVILCSCLTILLVIGVIAEMGLEVDDFLPHSQQDGVRGQRDLAARFDCFAKRCSYRYKKYSRYIKKKRKFWFPKYGWEEITPYGCHDQWGSAPSPSFSSASLGLTKVKWEWIESTLQNKKCEDRTDVPEGCVWKEQEVDPILEMWHCECPASGGGSAPLSSGRWVCPDW